MTNDDVTPSPLEGGSAAAAGRSPELSLVADDSTAVDEEDRLFHDEVAAAIFWEVFNPEDEVYIIERDSDRFRACVDKLVALGYSEPAARYFMNTNLSYCDD